MSDEEEHSENKFYYPDGLESRGNTIGQKQIINDLAREKPKETVRKKSENTTNKTISNAICH